MTNGQLELSLKARTHSPACQRRAARAQWWFQRMRQIVDSAINYPPAPETAPEFASGTPARQFPLVPANSRRIPVIPTF